MTLRITEEKLRRAVELSLRFEEWAEEHTGAWAHVDAAFVELASFGPVGANQLLGGVVPNNLVPCAAARLREDHPSLATRLRARRTVFDLL